MPEPVSDKTSMFDRAISKNTIPPAPGNGHDAGGDPLEVPAFLRRS